MDQETIRAIEALDSERCKATIAGDEATLNRLFTDDMLYVHGNAVAEDKATFVRRVCTRSLDYRGLTSIRRNWRQAGDVVLVDGDLRIEVVNDGAPKDFVTRYLQVWVKRDGRWQMLSWQSTPLPK